MYDNVKKMDIENLILVALSDVVRTSVTHSAIALCYAFLVLSHFDVFCDQLQNRTTAIVLTVKREGGVGRISGIENEVWVFISYCNISYHTILH